MNKCSLAVLSLLALPLASACSSDSVSYGDPTTPSASQMQAVGSLTEVGTNVSVATKGMSDANKAFSVHSLMAGLQGTAVKQSSSAQGLMQALELAPSEIDAACTTGTPATGFTYNNCNITSGTISGTVKITPTSADYDLKVSVGVSGATTELTLKGGLTFTGGRITGDLEYKIHIDYGSLGGLGGLGGAATADITTTAIFDITYTETPACITEGFIEVKVNQADTLHGAKFLFSGCNSVMVQNG